MLAVVGGGLAIADNGRAAGMSFSVMQTVPESIFYREGSLMPEGSEPNPFRSPAGPAVTKQADSLLGFWVALCVVGSVAIFLLPFWPGISILLALGLAPAFVHAYVRLHRLGGQGILLEPRIQIGLVIGSFFMVMGIALGVSIACGLVCFMTISVMSQSNLNEQWLLSAGFILGVVLPLVGFVVLFVASLFYPSRQALSKTKSLSSNSNGEEPK
ncbi:hypothetical protein DTL42_01265 [Bremerella cremea]|uniref:Uncharacterized protein n=1 Tax=Bremerella cremea TaxID=1031537 RepID=A0A368KZD5_9BACT|nr:hypothetical protein DTL42_01265 [Bremerella cremea]